MPYVVTQSCCSDAACVVACPVNAIHPTPGEPGFETTEMLFVDPATCVDCGACASACPVNALLPDSKLSVDQLPFMQLNASYYDDNPHADRKPLVIVEKDRELAGERVRVAVVGAGPAGLYAADELLRHDGVRVDVYDRLPTPHGLARFGVAPDHQETKQIAKLFGAVSATPGFTYKLDVEVGKDITHEQLAAKYHAVIYAVGAPGAKRLGIDGEDLPGVKPAINVVTWYNGHPDRAADKVDLSHERAVIIGNGNVALDVARILTADPESLADTDIADHALAALRTSKLREVVILGRRGPEHAAFTVPELIGLAALDDVDVLVEGKVTVVDQKTELLAELAKRRPREGRRRIVLRFNSAPTAIYGTDRAEGVRLGPRKKLEAGLVVTAIGQRGAPVKDLPFDDATGTVPNEQGRVEPGVYVTGWIKRGPRGFIGTNKTDAEQTVEGLLDDYAAGKLKTPEPRHKKSPADVIARRATKATRQASKATSDVARHASKATTDVARQTKDVLFHTFNGRSD